MFLIDICEQHAAASCHAVPLHQHRPHMFTHDLETTERENLLLLLLPNECLEWIEEPMGREGREGGKVSCAWKEGEGWGWGGGGRVLGRRREGWGLRLAVGGQVGRRPSQQVLSFSCLPSFPLPSFLQPVFPLPPSCFQENYPCP